MKKREFTKISSGLIHIEDNMHFNKNARVWLQEFLLGWSLAMELNIETDC